MGHTRQQYEDRIRSHLGDLGVLQRLREEQIPLALEEALITFSKDRPREASQSFSGDGTTFVFDLTADTNAPPWVPTWSRLVEVEHPAGQRIPELLDLRYIRERDGILTFEEVTPATGVDNVVIRYTTVWPFPTDTADEDLIIDIYFNAITALAGAKMAHAKGVEFARQVSTSVAGDLHDRNAGPLFTAAKALENVYEATVLGRGAASDSGSGTSSAVAMAVGEVDVLEHTLFHRREWLRE